MDRTDEDRAGRCVGGYVNAHAPKTPSSPGWWRAACPSCGRLITFHWMTGLFRPHNRPAALTPDPTLTECVVEVGRHPGPCWIDKNSGLIVCTRHKAQYEERADEFGPFDWQVRA